MIGHERVIHPGAVDIMHVHARTQLFDVDQLDGVRLTHDDDFVI
jgi:hypothetical protein